jgi:hypothetical protein
MAIIAPDAVNRQPKADSLKPRCDCSCTSLQRQRVGSRLNRALHPETVMVFQRLSGRPGLVVCALAAVLLLSPSAPAQGLGKAATSLDLVPDNALFYGASLRTREQIEAVLKSKAWARLTGMPVVQMVRQKFEEAWDQPGPQSMIKGWYEQEDNRKLVALLLDMFSDECFAYGGPKTADLLKLANEINSANQLNRLQTFMQVFQPNLPQPLDPLAQPRLILQALNDHPDLLVAPDLVAGFRVKDTANAKAQLERLDDIMRGIGALDPRFKDRWTKSKIVGGDFYTLRLDGEMIPMDQIPWQNIEERDGQFDKLKKKLRTLKLTLSIGLRDSFVIFGLGETPAVLDGLGDKRRLLSARKEFAQLAKFADRRLTHIGYTSPQWQSLTADPKANPEQALDGILANLKGIELTDKQRAKIKSDLKRLGEDFNKDTAIPGSSIGFTYLTGKGTEGYHYTFSTGQPYVPAEKPLSILKQVGGNPVIFAAGHGHYDPRDYKLLVKWIKIGFGYFEEIGLPQMPEEAREKYQEFMKSARPLFGRLDKATGEMLLPGLADAQAAFVLDAKLTSKAWHQSLPPSDKALPILEPAFILGVSDASLVRKAAKEYREIWNELVEIAGKEDLKVPPPETKKIPLGSLYYYPPADGTGLDEQLALTAGLSDRWLALTISPKHATRLLEPTPLEHSSKLFIADPRPYEIAFIRWPGLVDAIHPWIDYALDVTQAEALTGQNIRGQVRTVMDVLKCFRSSASISYVENGMYVTREETIIQDVD